MNFSLRVKTPFRDFKIRHKVYITASMLAVELAGTWVFLSYTTAHPEQEVLAGVIVFVATCILMFMVAVAMTKKFQRYYEGGLKH